MSVPTVSPEGFSSRDVLPVDAHSHLRNRIFGGIGMFSNIAALLLLWQSSRIRPPLKLVVISMSLCDLLTMTVAAVWGPHLPCWPALFFLSATILTSYFMATLLAFHNYVAVFFPANCHQLLGFGRTAIIVTLCWVGGHLIILACLGGIHIPRGASCYVTAVMSREGLVAVSIICLLCCFLTIFMNLRVVMRIRRRPEHMALRVPVPAMIRESNMCSGVPKRADFLARIRKRRTSSVTPTSCFAFSLARLPGVCGTTLNGSVTNLPDLVEAKCRKDTNDRPPRVPSLQRISNEARSVSQETSDLPERNDLATADAAPKVLKAGFKLSRQDLHENGPSHSVGSADSESITIGNHALRSTRLREPKTLKSSKSCDTLQQQQQQQHHQQQQQCSEAPRLSFPQNAGNAASWSNDTREKKVMTTPEIDINSEFIAKFHPIEHCEIDKQIPLKSTVVNETLEFNSDVDCIRQFDSNAKSTPTLGEIQEESIGNISPTNEQTVVSFPINTQSKQSQRHVVFSISEQASCSSAARVLSRRHSTRCGRVCKKQELGLSRSYSAKNLKEDSSCHGNFGSP
ncbi:hypothetical protein EGW08_014538 [Elysia chlorotica]|uniref:G-protein coupled receptors family 1 profile domain-containing protein n=1 Tax=Elysia chlorotica TaxID=188477 RepID=A0A3S1HEJ0_ELYCH|nr:hypothetical protein EGW08_014538 [Elysia chlorotica]